MHGLRVIFLASQGVCKQADRENKLRLGGVLVGLVEVGPAILEYSVALFRVRVCTYRRIYDIIVLSYMKAAQSSVVAIT